MRAAFTLIEALIAIALSIVICGAAYAALRATTQCVARAEQLGIENRLLRAGVGAAMDQLDFWTPWDDPTDPARQPLRGASFAAPFAPMTIDRDFAPSRPRAWWRGMPTGNPFTTYGDASRLARIGHPDPARRWLPETMTTVARTLGNYALLDYLPANTVFQAFGADGVELAEFAACEMTDPRARPRLSVPIGVTNDMPRDISGLTFAAGYAITTDPGLIAAGVDRSGFADYRLYGPLDDRWRTSEMHARCVERVTPLPLAPTHWPRLGLGLRRFVYFNRWVSLAEVRIADPLSGAQMKLHLTLATTTLRGARQQRGLDRDPSP